MIVKSWAHTTEKIELSFTQMNKTGKSIFWEGDQEISLDGSIKLELPFRYLRGRC